MGCCLFWNEIADIVLPAKGVFHNFVLGSIGKMAIKNNDNAREVPSPPSGESSG